VLELSFSSKEVKYETLAVVYLALLRLKAHRWLEQIHWLSRESNSSSDKSKPAYDADDALINGTFVGSTLRLKSSDYYHIFLLFTTIFAGSVGIWYMWTKVMVLTDRNHASATIEGR
jgi:hypothetical protein